jgi:uncharacterized lipoprotein YddW (UPF0748 family)
VIEMTNENRSKAAARATLGRRAGVRFAAVLACAAAIFAGTKAASRPRVALWIECEGSLHSLDTAARLRAAIDHAALLGATDVFLQVFRSGRAWFPTRFADDAPYERAKRAGYDPLALAIERAHGRGIRIHAWVNLLRIERGGLFMAALGPDAVLRDSAGSSLAEPGERFPSADAPGGWIDPASPRVVEQLQAVLGDLARAYPKLDGVHLDYVRYPVSATAGDAVTQSDCARPESATSSLCKGKARDALRDRAGRDALRRKRLTQLVRALRARLRQANPRLEFSAAVMPDPDRARGRALQDWPAWAEGGLFDFLVPMNYEKDPVSFARHARACVARRGRAAMLMGIGAWRLDGAGAVAARIRLAMDAGANGVALFSHDNLETHPGLFKRIGDLLRSEEVLPRGPATLSSSTP